jgi:hypothetical protein
VTAAGAWPVRAIRQLARGLVFCFDRFDANPHGSRNVNDFGFAETRRDQRAGPAITPFSIDFPKANSFL